MWLKIELIIPGEYLYLYSPATRALYLSTSQVYKKRFRSLERAKEVIEYGLNAKDFRYERSGKNIRIFGKKRDLQDRRRYKEYHLGNIEILD